jgi:transposase-like protein
MVMTANGKGYNPKDGLLFAAIVALILMCLMMGCAPKYNQSGFSSEIYVHDVIRRIRVEKSDVVCIRCGSPTIHEVGSKNHYCVNPKCKALLKELDRGAKSD